MVQWTSLRLRILSALVLAPAFILMLYWGGIPFAAMITAAWAVSLYEWVRMAQRGSSFAKDAAIGVFYLSLACASFVILRVYFDNGLYLVLALILGIWACDTGAYFAGKTIGGPKMCPKISPNKTWAGLAGGMAASGLTLVLFNMLVDMSALNPVLLFIAGAALGGVGQIGDLFISAMKRRVGVKDTGVLIPGHGGLLDRIDSLLLASPAFLAVCLLWL